MYDNNQVEPKGFLKSLNEFNYYTEAVNTNGKKSPLYDCYNAFITANKDILTMEQLDFAELNLLSPKGFDDDNIRSEDEYNNTTNNIRMIKNEKIQMIQNEQGRSIA